MRKRFRKLRARVRKARRRWRELRRRKGRLKRRLEKVAVVNEHLGHGAAIVEEAHRADVPLPLACALVEQESGGRNIFGCDLGPRRTPPWCHQQVNRERVRQLLRHIERGGTSNGVGLTQLTSPQFLYDAEAEGGAHTPRAQLRVGFDYLRSLLEQGRGVRWALGAYNGGPGNPQYGYADEVLGLSARWQKLLS